MILQLAFHAYGFTIPILEEDRHAKGQQIKKKKKTIWYTMLLFVSGLASATLVIGCLWSTPGYQGDTKPHFDGVRFINQDNSDQKGFLDFVKWVSSRKAPDRPKFENNQAWGARPEPRVGSGQARVTFINHATALIQMEYLNILTDPIWSERASPVSWAGPKRFQKPGVRFEDLPRIDLVLLSHDHYDHLDLPTLKKLTDRDQPLLLVGLGTGSWLRQQNIPHNLEMDWWQWTKVSDNVRIYFVPAQHFSGRGLFDRNKNLWGSFVIQSKSHTVYFAGDTGFGPHFEELSKKFEYFDLAMLPIGSYLPRWFMSPVHISPAEAVLAHTILNANHSMGIHFGTFPLADDGPKDLERDLNLALKQQGLSDRNFWVLGFGESRDIPSRNDSMLGLSPSNHD